MNARPLQRELPNQVTYSDSAAVAVSEPVCDAGGGHTVVAVNQIVPGGSRTLQLTTVTALGFGDPSEDHASGWPPITALVRTEFKPGLDARDRHDRRQRNFIGVRDDAQRAALCLASLG